MRLRDPGDVLGGAAALGSTLFEEPPRDAAEFAQRVAAGRVAWRDGDLTTFGALMNASCDSSIHNYETGSREMIRLFEILVETQGVLGARFSGAGFRGCAVALIDRLTHHAEIISIEGESYRKREAEQAHKRRQEQKPKR